MKVSLTLALTPAVLIALAAPLSAQDAQPQGGGDKTLTVDAAKAKSGKSLFTAKACNGCHTIGKGKSAGPDLKGVVERRGIDWLKRWLKETDKMLETDPTAQAMLKEYNNMKMPNMKLSDQEVDALLHYIHQESGKK